MQHTVCRKLYAAFSMHYMILRKKRVKRRRRPIYKMTKLGRLHMLQSIPEYRDFHEEFSFQYRQSMSQRRSDLNQIQYRLIDCLKPSTTSIEEPLVVSTSRSSFE